jgi:hypothetical protein
MLASELPDSVGLCMSIDISRPWIMLGCPMKQFQAWSMSALVLDLALPFSESSQRKVCRSTKHYCFKLAAMQTHFHARLEVLGE